jgi:integrase/recombinase XerD
MNRNNAENVRIKRDYFAHLKGPGRQSEASIDAVAKALSRFESYTRNKDFKTFRKEQAIGFTAHLSREVNERTGEPLSKATLLATLNALKAFFTWLSLQRGFKSKFTYLDAEYFALSLKDTAIAKTARGRPVPSIEQIRHVTLNMPSGTDIEKRDRALIALALMTGARDDALASLRLRHVDLDAGLIQQDARQVRTKFSKTFPTYFVPVGGDIRKFSRIGLGMSRRRCFGDQTIRCFQGRGWSVARTDTFRLTASSATDGGPQRLSERSSARRLRRRAFRISTRIRSGMH